MYSDNKSLEDHQMKNERHLDVQSLLTRRWHHRFVVRQNKKNGGMKNEPCDILLSPRQKISAKRTIFFKHRS